MTEETKETHGPGWDDYERAKREGRRLSSLVEPKPNDSDESDEPEGEQE